MAQSTLDYNQVQRSAWLTLLGFFGFFCALVAVVGVLGWQFYSRAMVPVTNTLLLRYAPTGVLVREPGLAAPQDIGLPEQRPSGRRPTDPEVCTTLTEGQGLVGLGDAGYGPVAALKLPDESRVNLHTQPDGFVFGLRRYQVSRWTDSFQDVVFEQFAGYARYDLADNQHYERVSYTVVISEDTSLKLFLEPGGSYSVDVPRELFLEPGESYSVGMPLTASGTPRGRLVDQPPVLVEVAVRSGSATIESAGQSLNIRPGEKVQVALDGTFVTIDGQADQEAAWELIPDGGFSFSTEQYNTPSSTETWSIGSNGNPTYPGEFSVLRTCAPDKGFCREPADQINYGQFLRNAPETDNEQFITGINNQIDADVSEYTRSLVFSALVTVIDQEVELTGVAGSECPVVVVITYKQRSPTDAEEFFRRCYFTGEGEYVESPGFTYQRIPLGPIQRVSFDLRNVNSSVRTAWYIQSIRIEARGQNYFSRVADVSLVGRMQQP